MNVQYVSSALIRAHLKGSTNNPSGLTGRIKLGVSACSSRLGVSGCLSVLGRALRGGELVVFRLVWCEQDSRIVMDGLRAS